MEIKNTNFDLFNKINKKNNKNENMPLASRMRPNSLNEFIGQDEILGKGKILRNLIEQDNIPSMIFWGPPGCGKTSISFIISKITKSDFLNFSAVTSGIKEIKDIMLKSENNILSGKKTILFVDEIHRFNKSQQDAFLPFVEKGNIILIGATTENPSFEINSALLSRLKVFVFKPLDEKDIENLLNKAIFDKKIFENQNYKINIENSFIKLIAKSSNGDARLALNTLEIVLLNSFDKEKNIINVTKTTFNNSLLKNTFLFDKNGEEHYNLISAFHKSMRNSDPDATVYYLARMLESGEDPLYIARRIIRFSSEDIGLADPHAMLIAIASFDAARFIGMPECSVNLTQAAIYMAMAPKSNSMDVAYHLAKETVYNEPNYPIPMHLRNAPTKLMKDLGYNKGYEYAHDTKEKLTTMECLPENIKNKVFYIPTEEGLELKYKNKLENIKNWKKNNKNQK